jgi:hypothetical protein
MTRYRVTLADGVFVRVGHAAGIMEQRHVLTGTWLPEWFDRAEQLIPHFLSLEMIEAVEEPPDPEAAA